MACTHPNCGKETKRKWCPRHWYALSDDLQSRLKRASSVEEKGGLLIEARDWLANERMIGPHEIVYCRGRAPDYDGCGQDICWLKTKQNKNMPVNAESVSAEDDYYEHGRHVPHWSTCAKAENFKK